MGPYGAQGRWGGKTSRMCALPHGRERGNSHPARPPASVGFVASRNVLVLLSEAVMSSDGGVQRRRGGRRALSVYGRSRFKKHALGGAAGPSRARGQLSRRTRGGGGGGEGPRERVGGRHGAAAAARRPSYCRECTQPAPPLRLCALLPKVLAQGAKAEAVRQGDQEPCVRVWSGGGGFERAQRRQPAWSV